MCDYEAEVDKGCKEDTIAANSRQCETNTCVGERIRVLEHRTMHFE